MRRLVARIKAALKSALCETPPEVVRPTLVEVNRLQTIRQRALRMGDFEKAERLARQLADIDDN